MDVSLKSVFGPWHLETCSSRTHCDVHKLSPVISSNYPRAVHSLLEKSFVTVHADPKAYLSLWNLLLQNPLYLSQSISDVGKPPFGPERTFPPRVFLAVTADPKVNLKLWGLLFPRTYCVNHTFLCDIGKSLCVHSLPEALWPYLTTLASLWGVEHTAVKLWTRGWWEISHDDVVPIRDVLSRPKGDPHYVRLVDHTVEIFASPKILALSHFCEYYTFVKRLVQPKATFLRHTEYYGFVIWLKPKKATLIDRPTDGGEV